MSVYSSCSHSINLKLSQDHRYTWDPTGDDGKSGGVTLSQGSQQQQAARVRAVRKLLVSAQNKAPNLTVSDKGFERQQPSDAKGMCYLA